MIPIEERHVGGEAYDLPRTEKAGDDVWF